MAYDPYQHADQLGLTVHYGNPGTGLLGLYIHRRRTIILRAGLSARVERCALAHEIVHAEYEDEPTSDGAWSARREARCDRIAAERLIDRETLLSTASAYEDMGEWAAALEVTGWILGAYLVAHPLPLKYGPMAQQNHLPGVVLSC